MFWSVAEIARMSGVTPGTLRYHDEIGLLPPAGIRTNGYRFYRQEQLLRLCGRGVPRRRARPSRARSRR
ncbi:MerR family DNA-binding transcriptional regulator [Nocardia gipuzkoensis]|nr:MerR family DNA-binding transcriptional regulator [Nocardia abscessus]